MNKTELVNEVAQKLGLSQAKAREAVTAVLDSLTQGLSQDEKVAITGFGSFAVKRRPAHMGFHPAKQEQYMIPESVAVSFHAGAVLKEALDKK